MYSLDEMSDKLEYTIIFINFTYFYTFFMLKALIEIENYKREKRKGESICECWRKWKTFLLECARSKLLGKTLQDREFQGVGKEAIIKMAHPWVADSHSNHVTQQLG